MKAVPIVVSSLSLVWRAIIIPFMNKVSYIFTRLTHVLISFIQMGCHSPSLFTRVFAHISYWSVSSKKTRRWSLDRTIRFKIRSSPALANEEPRFIKLCVQVDPFIKQVETCLFKHSFIYFVHAQIRCAEPILLHFDCLPILQFFRYSEIQNECHKHALNYSL